LKLIIKIAENYCHVVKLFNTSAVIADSEFVHVEKVANGKLYSLM
jgi:hypothetical protein